MGKDRFQPGDKEQPHLQEAIVEYGALVKDIETASDRMAAKAHGVNYHLFVNKFGVTPFISDDRIWVAEVENLNRIPFPPVVYHVTGGSVLNVFEKGGKLTPAVTHCMTRVDTDKGLALHLVPTFMKEIGLDTGCLEEFLFSGPQVDPEQIKHYQKMAGSDLNREITNLFLHKEGENTYVLAPDLEEILEALSQQKVPFEDPRLKAMVDNFTARLFDLSHTRDGWLEQIKNRLYGLTPIANRNDIRWLRSEVQEILSIEHLIYKDQAELTPHFPVVLEIDTQKLIEQTAVNGLFPVLVGDRPIETIFASMNIIPNAVTKIHVHPDLKVPPGLKIPVATLDDLPNEVWLGGVKWRDAQLNMANPLCAIRYTQGIKTSWFDIAKSGLIAPARSIQQSSLTLPPASLIDLFGKDNFSFTANPGYIDHPSLYRQTLNRVFSIVNGVFTHRNDIVGY